MDNILESSLKVKAERLSSFHENKLYFLSYFTVEAKYSSARTYLLMAFFTERENFFKNQINVLYRIDYKK